MTEEVVVKKRRLSRGCKHRFVNPLNTIGGAKDDTRLKCAWCKHVFETVEELEAEYTRLHIPFKRKSLDDFDKPNQTDFIIRRGFSQKANNVLSYSSFRWGGKYIMSTEQRHWMWINGHMTTAMTMFMR